MCDISPAVVCFFAVALLGSSSGCSRSGDRWQRVPVEGRVTIAAKANPKEINGLVTFVPADGVKGPAAATKLVAGTYKFEPGTGPVAGAHEAIVQVAPPKEPAAENTPAAPKGEGKSATGRDAEAKVSMPKKQQYAEHRLSVRVIAEKPYRIDLDLP